MLTDFRYALRGLLRTPAFTAATVLTLALGIGANTAIFSVVNAVLLRPLPYPQSDRLVGIWSGMLGGRGRFAVSYPDIQDLRRMRGDFSGVGAYYRQRFNLTGAGDPREVAAALVTANLFPLLGVQPALGRGFGAADERRPMAVISYAMWASSFGSDPTVVGRPITLDGAVYTVIGVMPATFAFPSDGIQVWLPIGGVFAADPQWEVNREYKAFNAVARLAPGATLERARADLDVLSKRIAAAERSTPDGGKREVRVEVRGGGAPAPGAGPKAVSGPPQASFVVARLRDEVTGNARPALLVLLGAVGLVLLIACVNAANLLVARAGARRRELAVRRALGAGRARLVRQLLAESLSLALGGGALGLLLGYWGVQGMLAGWPKVLPRAQEIGIDGTVLLFTLAVSLATGLLFGIVPALRASGSDLEPALRDESGGSIGGRGRRRLQGALVVGEMALALVLLVGSGLLVKSFLKLNAVDPGYDTHDVLAARIRLTPSRYTSGPAQTQFFEQVLARIRDTPGVRAAALARTLPLSGSLMMMAIDPRQVRPDDPDPFLPMGMSIVSPDYFAALRIPLRAGRTFTDQDRLGEPAVAMINERLAKRLWPNESPIGKEMPVGGPGMGGGRTVTVVGVIGDVHYSALSAPAQPEIYLPALQQPTMPEMWLVVRADRDPLRLAAAVRDAVHTADAEQPIGELVSLEQLIHRETAARRFNMTLISLFALLAVALAALGIYGVTTYAVTLRTREMGLRVALGARPADVLRLIVGEHLALVGLGVAIGLAAALGLTRMIASMLFDTSAADPVTFVAMALLLVAVALAATWLPARRATRVDPMEVLRHE